ncbi:MAG: hypothetical protein OSB41_11390 [Kiritimatiellae bacterium]|nr:hypothetical protein [Kiritimatiellia bacterium]
MGNLAWISTALGGVLLALYGTMCLKPDAALKAWGRFPRSVRAAWVLTSIDLIWAGKLLYDTPLGPVESYKMALFALVPIAIVLLVRFVDELLAVRALGGLLILVPAPILDAARWHPSPWRLFIIVLCYIMVIKGVVLVLAPYVVRKGLTMWSSGPSSRMRIALAIGMVMAVALIGLGLTVYRVA